MSFPREILKTRAPAGSSSTALARVFTDEEDHAFVQHRLGLLYGLLGGIVSGFYAIGVVLMRLGMPEQFWKIHLSPAKLLHLIVGPALIGIGIVCRRPRLLPRWLLSAFDTVGLFKVVGAAGLMIAFTPPTGIHAEFMILPAVALAGTLRAALVPSPPRWTALVVALDAASAPFTSYMATLRMGADAYPPFGRLVVAIFTTSWSVVTVVAAYLIARMVYGLRSEVKSATKLGQYTLEEKIGEGGMGVVYRARHALLQRPTAVKLLSPDRTEPHAVKRFEREVQLTSMLSHPNTVAIYDFGHTRQGVFYYAMEHLDGMSLHELVERDGPQSVARVIHILAQIAGALGEAHGVGLVHRDVKPANIFLCERGGMPDFVKVLDFGLVKHAGKTDPALSSTTAIAGTPHYMAPESILEPATVDGRVDVYALGAVGYYLLTGRTPFDGTNLVEICSHHLHTKPEPPSTRVKTPIDSRLEALLLACLEKDRERRPSNGADVLAPLGELARAHPWDLEAARTWWDRHRASRPMDADVADPTVTSSVSP